MSTAPAPLPTPQLSSVFDLLGQIYVLVDRHGTIVDLNETLLKLSGYEAAEVLGQGFHVLFSPSGERAVRQQAFGDIIVRGELSPYHDRPLLTRDGRLLLIRWHTGLSHDAEGQVDGIWAAGEELTDRSRANQLLTSDGSQFQDFLDSSQDLVAHLNSSQHLLFLNRAWKARLGYSDAELTTRTLADLAHPYYRAKLEYQLRQLRPGEEAPKVETVLLTKAGQPLHLIGSVSPLLEAGRHIGTRVILHDITDRIKAERLQKVYYSITNLAISAKNLPDLYAAIHRELSKIIETNNLFIALCDEHRTELEFVYLVDQNPLQLDANIRPFSTGLPEFIIRGQQPRFLLRTELEQLVRNGSITAYGMMPEVLLAAPLRVGERLIGVIVLQDYERADAYEPADLDILHFISNQVGLAIDRKRQEEYISAQNARLSAIFETGTHLMWTVDRKGHLISFNRNYAAFFLRRNGHYPTPGLNLLEADLARMPEDMRTLFMDRYRAAAAGQPQRFEVCFPDVRGRGLWSDIHLNPIRFGDGSYAEISAIAHDVTEQKDAQLALAAQEEKFRTIFESFQDLYYRTDVQGNMVLVSPSVREILGYEPAEVIGRPVTDFYYDPEDRLLLLAEIQETGQLRNFEARMRHKKGHPVTMLINARLAEGQTGTEGIGRDVSEMRQMEDDLRLAKEQAEAALEAKNQFLANMSHELRTPMNGIIGMIDLLDQTVTTDEQLDYVDTLRKSSDALLTILNDILDLSKIQAGKLRLHEAPLELRAALERIRALFSYRAEQKRLRFTYHVTPHTPTYIVTDEMRLLQILSNLVANAIKFTNEGTVSIVVSSVSTDGLRHTLRFAVQDSGIGITPADAARLFNAFTQLDTSPSKTYGGTGLGLAISKQLAELLGGDIGVLSNAGDGSVFWFTISCRAARAEDVVAAEPAPALTRGPSQPALTFTTAPRVLLVDDNAINRKVGRRLLAKLGCLVETANDGSQALAMATAPDARYDLIFMDIQMPEMDGVTATRELRKLMGESCPPVVAMTAYSMREDAQRFIEQGLDDYLAKPVKSQHLRTVLQRWVHRDKSQPAPEAAAAPAASAAPPAVAEPVAAAEAPVLDGDIVRQLQELGGSAFVQQLYQEFEVEASELIAQAAVALEAEDYAALLPLLHQLKGTAATLGLNSLAGQARHLEQRLKHGETAGTPAEFQLLQHYFAQVTAAYPTALASPES